MAKTKGSDPPVRELLYTDASGVMHYFGEFFRDVFREGSVSPRDPEYDISGQGQRGSRPSQQGLGTREQAIIRESFKNCSLLWNALPNSCPDPLPAYDVTSKESVWDAKQEHGVVCSYYDLFVRCCMDYAIAHNGLMPDGDCFPCISPCTPDPTMHLSCVPGVMDPSSEALVSVTGVNSPFSWSVNGTGFTLLSGSTVSGNNTLVTSSYCCGSGDVSVTGCDGTSSVGYVRCSVGRWRRCGTYLIPHCTWGNCLNPPPTPPDCKGSPGSGWRYKEKWRQHIYSMAHECNYGWDGICVCDGIDLLVKKFMPWAIPPFLTGPFNTGANQTAKCDIWVC